MNRPAGTGQVPLRSGRAGVRVASRNLTNGSFYALATPRPRKADKIMPDGARQKIVGSIWFPGPKI